MSQDCRTDRRRARVRARHRNGVDAVEVADDGRTLTVTFIGRAPRDLGPENIRIDGGRRIRGIVATSVELVDRDDPELDDEVLVGVDRVGDSSTYRLSVVRPDAHGFPGTEPYPDFDPRYTGADFDFRQMCPTEVDCAPTTTAPARDRPRPVIDYTARDYAALRDLLLARMTLTVPRWVERHAPDLGVTAAEVLAYVGDQLGYQQDAIATEAYLDTARRRTSVRRHARLVDYTMHDGCNARTFVALSVSRELTLAAGAYRFLTLDLRRVDPLRRPELGTAVSEEAVTALPPEARWEVFEPLDPGDQRLVPAHNEIRFWTWGDEDCRLPAGATEATLRDEWRHHDDERGGHRGRTLRLRPGDVLVIEEVLGQDTGAAADADPTHRQAVRLRTVTTDEDDLYDQPVVHVTWDPEDALSFHARLSSRGGQDCCPIPDVTVARGNVVLADHGRSGFEDEALVPGAPVTPPTCDPPAFGCGGGEALDPLVAHLEALATRTEGREPLTPDDVHDLVTRLGQDVTDRAGLLLDLADGREVVVPDTTEEQHDALRTLIAQLTYPTVPRRFRPELEDAPVTQCAPFPLPAHVAAAQALVLGAIPERVRAWLAELWRQVRGDHRLSRDQLAALTVLFGERTLAALEIRERPVRAMRELLARRTELLAAKTRRLDTLRARALAGGVLDDGIAWELRQSWGADLVTGLTSDDPALRGSARSALTTDPRAALPSVVVREPGGATWTPRRDLLDSGARDRHVVGEVAESERLALRFGDGTHGAAPPPGAPLSVHYRVGNGLAGNVGADAVNHVVLADGHDAVDLVRNPISAMGGVAPETLDEVRQLAPLALRRQQLRAITPDDYATLATRVTGVQRAAAQARWTGAGREIQVAVDPVGRTAPDPEVLDAVAHALAEVRRIGHTVTVGPAVLVPLDVKLVACATDGYQRGHVLAALRTALRGFFAPDALTFGQPVRVSALVAVAAAVPGVLTARVTRLRRQFGQDSGELETGLLFPGPLEVAQLDDDADHPENGRLTIELGGGR